MATRCPECDFLWPGCGDGKCNVCHGTGIVDIIGGTLKIIASGDDRGDCRRCSGTGVCPRCDGEGTLAGLFASESSASNDETESDDDGNYSSSGSDSTDNYYFEGAGGSSSASGGGLIVLIVGAGIVIGAFSLLSNTSSHQRSPLQSGRATDSFYLPPQQPTVSTPALTSISSPHPSTAPQHEEFRVPTRLPEPYRSPLRHDGAVLNIHPEGRATLVWSNGFVDVWADNSPRHVVLRPGCPLRFLNSHTVHAIPRSNNATLLFYRPVPN